LADKQRYCSRKPREGELYCYQHVDGKCKTSGPAKKTKTSGKKTAVKLKVVKKKEEVVAKPRVPTSKPSKKVIPKKSPISPEPSGKPGKFLTGLKDIDLKILVDLPYPDLLHACSVNKYAQELCEEDRLWKQRYEIQYPDDSSPKGKKTWREHYEDTIFRMTDSELQKLIKHVRSQVHPDIKISQSSIQLIIKLVRPVIHKLAMYNITDQVAFLPGTLSKHATAEYVKALVKDESITKVRSGGLGASKSKRSIVDKTPAERARDRVAVVEYLIAEVIELSGNCARDNSESTITPSCIYLPIINDEELIDLFHPSIRPFPYMRNIRADAVDLVKKNLPSFKHIKERWGIGDKVGRYLQNMAIGLIQYYGVDKTRLKQIKSVIEDLEYDAGSSLSDLIDVVLDIVVTDAKEIASGAIKKEDIITAFTESELLNTVLPTKEMFTVFRAVDAAPEEE